MANTGLDTNGSQFFIVTAPACPWMDGKDAALGRVVSGTEVVDAIPQVPTDAGDRAPTPVRIERVELVP